MDKIEAGARVFLLQSSDSISANDVAENVLKVPCILHMDSIRGSHRGFKNLFRSCHNRKIRLTVSSSYCITSNSFFSKPQPTSPLLR
ncbi:hypothetical protein HRI_004369700 [Hibiscus trionum]|uniref:Uncharacterized protein n=1 Tax=Hibiscus trionum TaxID=183268 RepID=A0A9W7J3Y9_HIBTR|nr:hypothetical protein HRI_004369700 [Hibiscus trionum]